MSQRTDEVFASALRLDETERADLVDRLVVTLSDPLDDPQYRAEIDRRIDDFRSGKSPGVPAEEVFRQMEAELAKIQAKR